MEDTPMTTKSQMIDTINRRAYDDGARYMQLCGVILTHDEADALGDEALDWLRTRLDLRMATTSSAVVFVPIGGPRR